jgi:hypothetical protein
MAKKYDLSPQETARIIEVATTVKRASLANPRKLAAARLRFKGGKLVDIPVRYVWRAELSPKRPGD